MFKPNFTCSCVARAAPLGVRLQKEAQRRNHRPKFEGAAVTKRSDWLFKSSFC